MGSVDLMPKVWDAEVKAEVNVTEERVALEIHCSVICKMLLLRPHGQDSLIVILRALQRQSREGLER